MKGSQASAQTQEQAEHRPIFTVNLTRRYACDRCRAHKLRCNRDLMTTTNAPCQRCRKARAKCTISSAVRLGVTPRKLQNTRNEEAILQIPSATVQSTYYSHSHARAPMQSKLARDHHGDIVATDTPHQPSQPSKAATMFEGTRLSSVPWFNMISLGEDSGIDFGALTPMSNVPTLPRTDRSQMCHAPHEAFDISSSSAGDHQGFQSLNQVPVGADALAISQNMETHLYQSSVAPGGSTEQSIDPCALIAVNPVTDNDTHTHTHTHTTANTSQIRSSSASVEPMDACIQQLSDLSASLMEDLDLIISCKTAGSFLFTPSDKAPTGYILKTPNDNASQNNAVGRMLEGSEKFLGIIKLYKKLSFESLAVASGSSSQSPETDQPHRSPSSPDRTDATQLKIQSPEDCASDRWPLSQEYINATGTNQEPAILTSGPHPSLPSVEEQNITVPFTLVILSCYSSLLTIYGTVFSIIRHVLECNSPTASTTDIPPTLRDLSINEFALESHHSLQIKILIQVSTYMLDAIQKAVDESTANCKFSTSLKTMMEEKCNSVSIGEETTMKGVRDLLHQIEAMV